MYGMINKGIEDLVISIAGEDTWRIIKCDAGIDTVEFYDSCQYNDNVTIKLVEAASKALGKPPKDILYAFGRHWVLYTEREGWASVFNLAGDTVLGIIKELDGIHARVQIALPDARMPHFSVSEEHDHWKLIYRSPRTGFAPMVLGLLDGLAEKFEESWDIQLVESNESECWHVFHLTQNRDHRTEHRYHAA